MDIMYFSLRGCCLYKGEELRNLGVIFDSFMNLEPHITQVCRVAYMHLSNVRKIRNIYITLFSYIYKVQHNGYLQSRL